MEFFDKLTKKATETYKEAAEKTGKIAKETKLKIKINDNKTKINAIYEQIGKKVYQKHAQEEEEFSIKDELQEECTKIDVLANEIEIYNREILALSNQKECIKCKEKLQKDAKFCTKCGAEQPNEETTQERKEELEVLEAEVVDSSNEVSNAEKEEIQENFKEEAKREVECNQKDDEENKDDGTEKNENETNAENKENKENKE